MRLMIKNALLPIICLAMALSACQPKVLSKYRVPEFNEADKERFDCVGYPSLTAALAALPAHKFLEASDGQRVVTEGQYVWVRFDVADSRESLLIQYGGRDGKKAHFVCRDNLLWSAKVITDLQKAQDE